MKAALEEQSPRESAFLLPFRRPTPGYGLQGRYAFVNDNRSLDRFLEIQRDRWVAKVGQLDDDELFTHGDARYDTWRYHAGEPVCIGWTPSPRLSRTRRCRSVLHPRPGAGQACSRGAPSARLGPVNNTPPQSRTSWKTRARVRAAPSPACGRRAVDSGPLRKTARRAMVFTIAPEEKFTAVTADVTSDSGYGRVSRHDLESRRWRGEPIDSIRLRLPTHVYLLNVRERVSMVVVPRPGSGMDISSGREPYGMRRADPTDPAVVIRGPRSVWWVRVAQRAGREGWIVGDYHKMAPELHGWDRALPSHAKG